MRIDVNEFLNSTNGKCIPENGKVILKEFKTIHKALPMLGLWNHSHRMPVNIDGIDYKLVFTSDPWDIATMSNRGASSCMSWVEQIHPQLIGSMVDPFLSMIYLTDGQQTVWGERIIKRSIVRLAFIDDNANSQLATAYAIGEDLAKKFYSQSLTVDAKKPMLFIERIYKKPATGESNREKEILIPKIMDAFKSYLASNSQYDITYVGDTRFIYSAAYAAFNGRFFIPKSKAATLAASKNAYSYIDSKMRYYENEHSKKFMSFIGID